MAIQAPIGGTEPNGNGNGNGHRSSSLEPVASQDLLRRLWRYQPYLKRLCESIVGDAATAEDVVQDTFERALVHLPRLDTHSSLFPWLATVARRCALNELRRRQYATPVEAVPEESHLAAQALDDTADRANVNATLERVGQALDLLTARERDLLFRQVDGGPSLSELAATESSSRDSIKSVLKRARRKLREATYGAAAWVLAPIGLVAARVRDRFALSGGRFQQLGFLPGAERVGEMATAAVVVMAIGVGGTSPAVERPQEAEREHRAGTSTTLDGRGLPIAGARGIRPLHSALLESGFLGGGGAGAGRGGWGRMGSTGDGASASGDEPAPGSEMPPPFGYGDGPGSAPSTTAPPRPREDVDPENPLHEAEPRQPEEAHIEQLSGAAPTGDGREVFALGTTAGYCEEACTVLFHSGDGGGTWELRSADGLDAFQLLPAPDYPSDPRIYAMGPNGLQVSLDGGQTFGSVARAPYRGPAAMSPGFSQGDQRILIGSGPIWVYDAASDTARPFAVRAPIASSVSHLAFVPGDVSGHTVFVGTKVVVNGTARSAVLRCEGDECDEPVLVPVAGPPQVFVAADGTVFAWAQHVLLRSVDGGRTFDRLELPVGDRIQQVTAGPDALYVAVADQTHEPPTGALLASSDRGSSWHVLGSGTALGRGVASVIPTSGGRLLAAPIGPAGSGLLCSRDRGATWKSRC